MCRLQKYLKIKNNNFRYFSNGYVVKVPINGKRKVFGTFPIGTLGKYLKMKKIKVLGTFPMGMLEKYLKMKN